MELYQLNSFVTVARLCNLTRAAENLNISLSALSSQIKQLEDELEVKLFKRKPRGMELTPQGHALLHPAIMAVDSAYEIRRQALSMHREIVGRLTVGLNTDPVFLRVAQLNKEIARVLHKADVNYITSQTTTTAEMLRSGEIDMGFIYGTLDDSDVTTFPVHTAIVQAVIPKALMESSENATWQELAELPWVWGSNDCPFNRELVRRVGKYVPPKKIIMVTDEVVVKELVKSGQGACILRTEDTEELLKSGLVGIWKGSRFEIPLSIAVLSCRLKEPLIDAALTVTRGIFVEKCVPAEAGC